jgi:16S rRNA (guanine527-N7)-methyltransferase
VSDPVPPSPEPEVLKAVFGRRADVAEQYVALLATIGVERGLIGPREAPRLWERHVFNSVAVADLVPPVATVVDVGSGAGLPGIPLAVRRPDLRVTLLEPLLRRSVFLTEVVDALGLGGQVTVVRGRAEEHRSTYDVVTSRAVAPLPRLVEWCLPLTAPGGAILALKGRSAEDEVRDASEDLRRRRLVPVLLEVQPYPAGEATTVVQLRRTVV